MRRQGSPKIPSNYMQTLTNFANIAVSSLGLYGSTPEVPRDKVTHASFTNLSEEENSHVILIGYENGFQMHDLSLIDEVAKEVRELVNVKEEGLSVRSLTYIRNPYHDTYVPSKTNSSPQASALPPYLYPIIAISSSQPLSHPKWPSSKLYLYSLGTNTFLAPIDFSSAVTKTISSPHSRTSPPSSSSRDGAGGSVFVACTSLEAFVLSTRTMEKLFAVPLFPSTSHTPAMALGKRWFACECRYVLSTSTLAQHSLTSNSKEKLVPHYNPNGIHQTDLHHRRPPSDQLYWTVGRSLADFSSAAIPAVSSLISTAYSSAVPTTPERAERGTSKATPTIRRTSSPPPPAHSDSHPLSSAPSPSFSHPHARASSLPPSTHSPSISSSPSSLPPHSLGGVPGIDESALSFSALNESVLSPSMLASRTLSGNSASVLPGVVLVVDLLSLGGPEPSVNYTIVSHFKANTKASISCMALDPTGTLLATAHERGDVIRIFKISPLKLEPLSSHRCTYVLERGLTASRISGISFSPDSKLVAVTTSPNGTTHFFPILPEGGAVSASTHVHSLASSSLAGGGGGGPTLSLSMSTGVRSSAGAGSGGYRGGYLGSVLGADGKLAPVPPLSSPKIAILKHSMFSLPSIGGNSVDSAQSSSTSPTGMMSVGGGGGAFAASPSSSPSSSSFSSRLQERMFLLSTTTPPLESFGSTVAFLKKDTESYSFCEFHSDCLLSTYTLRISLDRDAPSQIGTVLAPGYEWNLVREVSSFPVHYVSEGPSFRMAELSDLEVSAQTLRKKLHNRWLANIETAPYSPLSVPYCMDTMSLEVVEWDDEDLKKHHEAAFVQSPSPVVQDALLSSMKREPVGSISLSSSRFLAEEKIGVREKHGGGGGGVSRVGGSHADKGMGEEVRGRVPEERDPEDALALAVREARGKGEQGGDEGRGGVDGGEDQRVVGGEFNLMASVMRADYLPQGAEAVPRPHGGLDVAGEFEPIDLFAVAGERRGAGDDGDGDGEEEVGRGREVDDLTVSVLVRAARDV
eukprot:TRINITY_DN5453_c0_g1_i1.p1 TRINITY_DN5453_c0_g1~~TRINITY_DN5453_c0_g1_i1.p1  ORF type:complete len:1029 (+),score=240.13 TRINITY_DN5453_c0_g1_i1:50-3136(+)